MGPGNAQDGTVAHPAVPPQPTQPESVSPWLDPYFKAKVIGPEPKALPAHQLMDNEEVRNDETRSCKYLPESTFRLSFE